MSQLVVPTRMGEAIATAVREAGAATLETGGFMLGEATARRATVLALAGEAGVTRRRDLFHVSGLALAALFEWTADRDLTVLAQWHSHRLGAFLSTTDLEHGLNVPGFYTTIVPFYEHASGNPAHWGWWTFNGHGWIGMPPPQLTQDEFDVVSFEEGDVRER